MSEIMRYVKRFREYHEGIFALTQTLEHEMLKLVGKGGRLTREEYLDIILPNREQFKTGLLSHFKSEELALFPILMRKPPNNGLTVFNLIVEHAYMIEKIRQFEASQDYDSSAKLLGELFSQLVKHAKTEDNLFGKVAYTPEEEEHILAVATVVDTWPPIIPY
ncbi:MAG: hemerythrin domain-containing protein [Thaumarchaeota archaeon]|nr:hemerythrin domain-containing protein [Nitrososphaerota archaeon]